MAKSFNISVYGKVWAVRQARVFDLAGLFMRIYSFMSSIGTISMLTLAGYSAFEAGTVASAIAASVFILGPRVSKKIDELGQRKVIAIAAAICAVGGFIMLTVVSFHGPLWPMYLAAILMGCIPNPQAIVRARWTYLIANDKVGDNPPSLQTVYAYEGIIDNIGFMIAPAMAIMLSSTITPIAGLGTGVVLFVIGSIIMVGQKDTEPEIDWNKNREQSTYLAETSNDKKAKKENRSIFLTSPVVRILFLLALLMGSIFGMFDTTTVVFAEHLGAPEIAGYALAAGAVTSTLAAMTFGMVAPRMPMRRLVVIFATGMGLAYTSMMFIDSASSLIIISICCSLFYPNFIITSNALCESVVPSRNLTEALTWITSGVICGIAFGPSLSGAFIDMYGYHMGYLVGSGVAATLAVTALLSARKLDRIAR